MLCLIVLRGWWYVPALCKGYEGVGVVRCDGGVMYLSDCFIKLKGDVSVALLLVMVTVCRGEGYDSFYIHCGKSNGVLR